MEWVTLMIFVPACFALNMSPGPNNLLAMNNAKRYGLRTAWLAGIGRLTAFFGMITLVASGLATILYASELFFLVVKTVGACYLFWLAYQLWNADGSTEAVAAATSKSLYGLGKQEFLLAAGNPKAILIFTAFLPQFVDPNRAVEPQFFILGGIFLCLEWIAIAIYGCFGSFLRSWFSRPAMQRLFNRCCSGLLATAGVVLLAARREVS